MKRPPAAGPFGACSRLLISCCLWFRSAVCSMSRQEAGRRLAAVYQPMLIHSPRRPHAKTAAGYCPPPAMPGGRKSSSDPLKKKERAAGERGTARGKSPGQPIGRRRDGVSKSGGAPLFRKSAEIAVVWIERREVGERRAANVGCLTHLQAWPLPGPFRRFPQNRGLCRCMCAFLSAGFDEADNAARFRESRVQMEGLAGEVVQLAVAGEFPAAFGGRPSFTFPQQ